MPTTLMWGERGLVATFFLDLHGHLDRWRSFLNTIQFCPPGPGLNWNDLEHVWAVVEPHFGTAGFGSPDLVARLNFAGGQVAVLFAEAKCVSYDEASRGPAMRRRKGYSSSINGQIELNHRLALALQHSRDLNLLSEPAWVDDHTCYVRGDKRRYVRQDGVLSHLVPQLNAEGVTYLHLAITTDVHSPFVLAHPEARLPIILNGNHDNAWDTERHRLGGRKKITGPLDEYPTPVIGRRNACGLCFNTGG